MLSDVMTDLKKLFEPESIAVVGASQDQRKAGYIIIRNLIEKNYKGEVYPITPKYDFVDKFRAYSSLKELGKVPDLVVVAVNVNISNSIIREAFELDVPFVVVITAGYKEIHTKEGIEKDRELEEIIKEYRKKGKKTRVVGPNCLGIYDNIGKVDLLFLPKDKMFKPKKGNLAFISQSGAIGAAFLDKFSYENIGLSRFVSYGNAIDLKEYDFFDYFGKDKETSCILAYLEGINDGERFFRSLKKTAPKKPVVILKGGKSKKGGEATQSHTGSLAGSYEVLKGVFRQTKVTEAQNEEELYDYGKLFSFYNYHLKSNRVGVITNGGGFGVICADMLEKYNLIVPDFENKTKEVISDVLPDYASIHNPLDLIGDANVERYKIAIEALIKDKNIDIILVILLLQTFSLGKNISQIIIESAKKTKKPIVVVSMGSNYSKKVLSDLELKRIPVYETPERAIRSLKVYSDYYLKD